MAAPNSPELSRRYRELLDTQKFTDCTFTVDGQRFNAHKLILSAASPVFEAMFYGPMSSYATGEHPIDILDIGADTFKTLIEYIYTGELTSTNTAAKESLEKLIELYYSAEKYLLNDLCQKCLAAIQHKLRFHNILPAMDLSVYIKMQPLLQVCLNFFTKCCLNATQFTQTIQKNYYHVTRDCIKLIVKLNFESTAGNYLTWFVNEWCRNECNALGNVGDNNDFDKILKDIQIPNLKKFTEQRRVEPTNCFVTYSYIERTYYKACRPFVIGDHSTEFHVIMRTDHFISLLGLVIHGRMMPRLVVIRESAHHANEQNYLETLSIEITGDDDEVLHRQTVTEHKTGYNCDLSLLLDTNVILSPGLDYKVKFMWPHAAYNAEYPKSLCSNECRGITFVDCGQQSYPSTDCGTILKGIKYLNLV